MTSGGCVRRLLVLLVLLLSACVTPEERAAKRPAPVLDEVIPAKVMAGEVFQAQPDGSSALSVRGRNLTAGSRVLLNGQPLPTSSGDGTTLAVIVPQRLTERDLILPITVESPDGQVSNALPFIVLPRTGPAPVIEKLYPDSAKVGVPFNEQPGGRSALGITGKNFLPGATIVVNGEALDTNFGDVDKLAALVPQQLLAKAGTLRVVIRNKDGKESAAAALTVQ